jgi:hypothetical protein
MVVAANMLIPLVDHRTSGPQRGDTLAVNHLNRHPAQIGLDPPNPVRGAVWIPLRNRRGAVVAYTLIDEENVHLAALRWHVASGYAHRWERHAGRQLNVFLHRVILGVPPELECDHINHDRLDNRRSNLRFATRSQNARNVKGRDPQKYKGVYLVESANRWRGLITFDGKTYPLGLFATPEAAAFAYDFAAAALHGEFAATNFQLSEATRRRAVEFGSFLVAHNTRRTV